jgi:hypothetical protein
MNVKELTIEERQRRRDLVHNLKQGEMISLAEAHELRNLLEREKQMLSQQGNCLPFFAATFLIGYVDEYLQSKSNGLLASEE